MIGFVLLGTNDLDRAGRFYGEICGALGAKRLYSMTNGCRGLMYGEPATGRCSGSFCLLMASPLGQALALWSRFEQRR